MSPDSRAFPRTPVFLGAIFLVWLAVYASGLFRPALLDDADSVHLHAVLDSGHPRRPMADPQPGIFLAHAGGAGTVAFCLLGARGGLRPERPHQGPYRPGFSRRGDWVVSSPHRKSPPPV